tara:strand:+ start:2664 stop:2936 length:273 start_codon:yes stop_codon:yes gene_type:complete
MGDIQHNTSSKDKNMTDRNIGDGRSKPFMSDYLPEQEEPTVDLHGDYRDEVMEDEYEIMEDDGQPSEYDEWQDYMGGDDWDHGQYDSCDW